MKIDKISGIQIIIFAFCIIFFGGFDKIAKASEQAYITKPSKYSVVTTIDRLEKQVKRKGMTVFARVNHQAGAESAGLSLAPSEVLIFGNPKIGTPLMNENPAMGLNLPLRVLSYQGPKGKTWVTYLKPEILLKGSAVAADKKITEKMTKALDGMTSWASGK